MVLLPTPSVRWMWRQSWSETLCTTPWTQCGGWAGAAVEGPLVVVLLPLLVRSAYSEARSTMVAKPGSAAGDKAMAGLDKGTCML